MHLSDVFTAVAHKELVAVDLPDAGSNQHELDGVAALKRLFGTGAKTSGAISWRSFADDCEPEGEDGEFTFYDARAKSAARTGRSEWRFYYRGDFLSRAQPGDLLVVARSSSGAWFGLVFARDSSWARAARELLGLHGLQTTFNLVPGETLDAKRLQFLEQRIIEHLDLDIELPVPPDDGQLMVDRFGKTFPTTRDMSAFARTQAGDDFRNPDEVLVRWLEREEQLFRALENVIIGERLQSRFASVDEFVAYSLSVQNRRKARMGHALQNHLAELFARHGLRCTPQARTEAHNRPDFVFPGEREYRNAAFDASLLVMLGVKSTSKDRWRQVLTEADRIPGKHLCTLEPGISVRQTEEMARQNLTLVVPAALHTTYTPAQRAGMLAVGDFIELVQSRQR